MMLVESYKIKGWKNQPCGLLVDENDDWILIRNIEVDYLVDGYLLINKNHVEKRTTKGEEKRIKKVLKLKNVKPVAPEGFKFKSTLKMMLWTEKNNGLVEFNDQEEGQTFYAYINRYSKKSFIIDLVDVDGNLDENFQYEFKLKRIRTIGFGSDYFNSIVLLLEDKLTKA